MHGYKSQSRKGPKLQWQLVHINVSILSIFMTTYFKSDQQIALSNICKLELLDNKHSDKALHQLCQAKISSKKKKKNQFYTWVKNN